MRGYRWARPTYCRTGSQWVVGSRRCYDRVVARWAWVVVLGAVTACGRIGFDRNAAAELLEDSANGGVDAAAPEDGGETPDANVGVMDASVPRPDASADDASVDDASMDASVDAASPLDAGRDAGGLPDAAVPEDGDFCEDVFVLPQRPLIDGTLEAGLTLRRLPQLGWTGPRALPADREAFYAVAYHADGIYVFVSVTDSTRLVWPNLMEDYCGDGVEIYLDTDGVFGAAPDYDAPGTVQFVVAAPVDDTPSARGSRWSWPPTALGTWDSPDIRAVRTDDGYDVEVLIAGADLELPGWTPTGGSDIGLAVAVNVAEVADDPEADCGHRLGQFFNRVTETPRDGWCYYPYCTTDAFCVAPLQP